MSKLAIIFDNVEALWNLWDIPLCLLLSLFLQGLLMLFAPFRQRSRSIILLLLIWSIYVTADWIAAFTIRPIIKPQNDSREPKPNVDVFALWASFLLLHLGGPGTIASFGLDQNNDLWFRYLFGLVLQVGCAAYSFILTLPENKLLFPTILVFIVGTIKYSERTVALYLASLDHFGAAALPKPYPGPDYEEAVTEYSTTRSVGVPEQTETTVPDHGNYSDRKLTLHQPPNWESDQMEVMQIAYSLFDNFKGFFVGFFLSSKQWESSREFFLKRNSEVSFRLIKYELSFMYQVLHTKVAVLRTRAGLSFRFICFIFLVVALMLFQFLVDKDGFKKYELILTYCMLIGAIVLDIFSGIGLILSGWFLTALKKWKKYIPDFVWTRKMWSKSVSQYNMIGYCIHEPWIWDYQFPDFVRSMLDKMKILRFSSLVKNIEDLKRFIFEEVKNKSSNAKKLSEAIEKCSQRRDGALFGTLSYIMLKWSISEFQYTESLLLWHLATELCYHAYDGNPEEDDKESRRNCQILSDYMFYLLVMKPIMLEPVLGNWQIVFRDTLAEAKRYFFKCSISDHSKACKQLIHVKAKFRPAAVKGTRSKSLLFDACILAQQLQHLEEEYLDQWTLMSKVWVELLCYGAINCRPIVHVQQPSKGGELLTVTWLLMNHLGMGLQFNEQEIGKQEPEL